MKQGIHPDIHQDAKVTCTACKAVFLIPGTKKDIQIEICSSCHPIYTGKYRGIMSSGQVDKFKKKMATAKRSTSEAKPKKRKLGSEDKLRKRLAEARAEKDEKKKIVAEKQRERAKRAAEKTVKKPGKKAVKDDKATKTKKKKN